MYEVVQLSEQAYAVESPARVGLVRLNETEVAAIDSGSDKDAGKKVLRAVQANGWKLTAIYNTHSHADHIGGNRYLQEQTGCRIFARGAERAFTECPLLEPAVLYGGCPPDGLRHKFLMAQESRAGLLTEETLPEGWQLLPLPGHSPDQVGFRTADGVVYLADCLSAKETLEKYGLGYLWNVGDYLDTLARVRTMEAKRFVPAHAAVTDEIAPLAQYNIDAVLAAAEKIASFCAESISFDALLQKVFAAYQMTMTLQQYALIGSTVRSYLAWLEHNGQVAYTFEDNKMLWHKA